MLNLKNNLLIRAAKIVSLMILVIATVGFSEVNWSGETVDSIANGGNDFFFNSLALDSSNTPHIVYNKNGFTKIIYSSKFDSVWQKEVVDSGFCYGYSLIFDTQNTPHLCYYNRDISLDRTYICYAYRDSSGWLCERIDTISGYLGNYFWLTIFAVVIGFTYVSTKNIGSTVAVIFITFAAFGSSNVFFNAPEYSLFFSIIAIAGVAGTILSLFLKKR